LAGELTAVASAIASASAARFAPAASAASASVPSAKRLQAKAIEPEQAAQIDGLRRWRDGQRCQGNNDKRDDPQIASHE
jgi:hypothetical protein